MGYQLGVGVPDRDYVLDRGQHTQLLCPFLVPTPIWLYSCPLHLAALPSCHTMTPNWPLLPSGPISCNPFDPCSHLALPLPPSRPCSHLAPPHPLSVSTLRCPPHLAVPSLPLSIWLGCCTTNVCF